MLTRAERDAFFYTDLHFYLGILNKSFYLFLSYLLFSSLLFS